jgi:hypothetical protein
MTGVEQILKYKDLLGENEDMWYVEVQVVPV